jgi:hypothetical protein
MKFLLVSSALAAALVVAPAYAQQSPPKPATGDSATTGTVTVQGVEPSKVLGSIDTSKLVDEPAVTADAQVAVTSEPPTPKSAISVDTSTRQTADAIIDTKTEVITPVSDRPKLDPSNPIAPEVLAVANSGKKYSTKDIVLAQLEAIKATPVTTPTTTITTTVTTPTEPASPPAG